MPRKIIFLIMVPCLLSLFINSERLRGQESAGEREESEEIETDRDSFTPATTTVGKGRSVFEAAYSFIDNRSVPETHSYPEILFRHGLTENLELRLGWNYEIGGAGNPISGNVPNDLNDADSLEEEARVIYGMKFFLSDQQGWIPQSSFILQGSTPTFGEATETQLSATHVVGWQLPNQWVLDFATRYGTEDVEEDDFNTWAPSTVLKIPVGERWKIHAEYFGVFTDGREEESAQHFLSPGAHYLINENLEFGTRVGWGLNDQSANFFANTGFGWRF
jgi:hypothetical protein